MSNDVADRYIRRYTGLGEWGARRAAEEGVAYTHQPYAEGVAGVKQSLTEMARLMREARQDKDVCGYAADVLRAAGIDGRDRSRWTARNVAQALLDNVRQTVMYSPDPAASEMITSPAGQLCLRPGLCIRKEDCDGLTTLLGALCMSVGFEVRIVKQSWGPSQQEHVLLAVRDEDGRWLKCDPSHASLPVGRGVQANQEEMYDPLDAQASIDVGAGAEIVTFGALPGLGRGGGGGGGRGGGGGGGRSGGGGGGGVRPGGGVTRGPSGQLVRLGVPRRFSGGRWWDWNGSSWIVSTTIACLQWGAPIVAPADLFAFAQSQLSASGGQPVSNVWTDGGTYLFTIESGRVTIRPCVSVSATTGVGRAVNQQLAPRRIGVGSSYSADQIQALLLEVSGIMDQTEQAVASAYSQGCLDQGKVLAFRTYYAGWVATRDALSECLADSLPSIHTSCSPFYALPGDWSQAQAVLTGYKNTIEQSGGWQDQIATACSWYTKPPAHETPAVPPASSPTDWLDKLKQGAYVVGGVMVLGVAAYATYKVVQVGSILAKVA